MKRKLFFRALAGILSMFLLLGVFSVAEIVAIAEEMQTEAAFQIPKK